MRTHTLLLPLLAWSLPVLLPGDDELADPFTRYELANGVRLAVFHVPDATLQATFTLLPFGLRDDPRGRAQLAHVVEHMLIRSTDPTGFGDGELRLNGETTATAVRLESMAPPGRWKEALGRHARWLSATSFEPDVLEREKESALAELLTTVPSGFTGKWAEAAWAQVALFGATSVAVRGDVERLDVDDVAESVRARVPIGPEVEIVCSGPIEPADVLAEAQRSIGGLERREASAERAEQRDPYALGDVDATWDLAAKHYLEWYPLGESDAAARVVLASCLHTELLLDAGRGEGPSRVQLASVSLLGAPRPGVLFSFPIGADGDVEKARAAVEKAIASTRRGVLVRATIASTAAQVRAVPDFTALRRRFEGRPNADVLEAQVALDLVSRERATGLRTPDFARRLAELDADEVRELAKELADAKRSSVLLAPRP